MKLCKVFGYGWLVTLVLISLWCSTVSGEKRLRDMLKKEKDKKVMVAKKLKKAASNESLKQFIKEIDSSGVIRKIIKRKIHIPKDSSLTLTSQVSRPNIFPNIFNQGDGFIVDAVVEWPLWLDLHAFAEAMNGIVEMEHPDTDPSSGRPDSHPGEKSDSVETHDATDRNSVEDDDSEETESDEDDDDILPFIGPPILGGDDDDEFKGRSMPGITDMIGLERCHIYEKIESGMSIYLNVNRNQSHDCVLRAICEAQLIADHYLDAPSSIFFEMIHLVLKPSLGKDDACYEKYLPAERAAYQAPMHCSDYLSKCPLNIAGLFVRNFFPEIF